MQSIAKFNALLNEDKVVFLKDHYLPYLGSRINVDYSPPTGGFCPLLRFKYAAGFKQPKDGYSWEERQSYWRGNGARNVRALYDGSYSVSNQGWSIDSIPWFENYANQVWKDFEKDRLEDFGAALRKPVLKKVKLSGWDFFCLGSVDTRQVEPTHRAEDGYSSIDATEATINVAKKRAAQLLVKVEAFNSLGLFSRSALKREHPPVEGGHKLFLDYTCKLVPRETDFPVSLSIINQIKETPKMKHDTIDAVIDVNKEAMKIAGKLAVGKTANTFVLSKIFSKFPWYAKFFGKKKELTENPLARLATAQVASTLAKHFAQDNSKLNYIADSMVQEAMVEISVNSKMLENIVKELEESISLPDFKTKED